MAPKDMPEVVLVMGRTGAGKSTFIKAATGLDVEIGTSLSSCTDDVQLYPVRDTKTFLIDTPGFDGSDPSRTDASILLSIASCLADLREGLLIADTPVDLSGVIFAHDITSARMTGSAMNNLSVLRNLIGPENLTHCVLLTTKWSIVDPAVGQHRVLDLMTSTSPPYWRPDLASGATLARFDDTPSSALEALLSATRVGPFEPQLVREYVRENRPLLDTGAGRALDARLTALRDEHRAEMEGIAAEYEIASCASDAEALEGFRRLREITELKLKGARESDVMLRATREGTQEGLDGPEAGGGREGGSDDMRGERERVLRARMRRARRWMGRAAAMGAAVAMTVVSHGVLAPAAVGLYSMVETMCQSELGREEGGKGGGEGTALTEVSARFGRR